MHFNLFAGGKNVYEAADEMVQHEIDRIAREGIVCLDLHQSEIKCAEFLTDLSRFSCKSTRNLQMTHHEKTFSKNICQGTFLLYLNSLSERQVQHVFPFDHSWTTFCFQKKKEMTFVPVCFFLVTVAAINGSANYGILTIWKRICLSVTTAMLLWVVHV